MDLVTYSDSETSDIENAFASPVRTARAATPKQHGITNSEAKPSLQKVVDRSHPNKIRVSLPDSSLGNEASSNDDSLAGPPLKRARRGGSAFSRFNDFLPTPKNPPKAGKPDTGRLDGRHARHTGISLKTDASPSFVRNPPQDRSMVNTHDDPGDQIFGNEHANEGPRDTNTPPSAIEEVKFVGKPTMFKPLSVSRKSTKKKKMPLSALSHPPPASTKGTAQHTQAEPTTVTSPMMKVKRSLFSSYDEPVAVPSELKSTESIVNESRKHILPVDELSAADSTNTSPNIRSNNQNGAHSQSLHSLAASLELTSSQRRQLFGRNAKNLSEVPDAQVAHFSLAAEYSNNNALRENESTAPAHNPVRSIAPGKHSLQQLVNAATSQRDALEESFATGKANKKSAGSKYGW